VIVIVTTISFLFNFGIGCVLAKTGLMAASTVAYETYVNELTTGVANFELISAAVKALT